jgi:hypothetical protein
MGILKKSVLTLLSCSFLFSGCDLSLYSVDTVNKVFGMAQAFNSTAQGMAALSTVATAAYSIGTQYKDRKELGK